MKGLFCFLFFPLFCGNTYSRQVCVGLFNNSQVRSAVVSAYNGRLAALQDGRRQFTVADGQAVYITLHDGKMRVHNSGGIIGYFNRLCFQGADTTSVVRLKPVTPQFDPRNYEGKVWLYAGADRIRLVNQLDEERYIAGVVEAEVGQGKTAEFYKAKAVICRTYLYGHVSRHETEGFHLCDETHCQAYKGQCRQGTLIKPAVSGTQGIILTDRKNSKPVLAAYHSNCGGETESAKNAWQSDMPYLVPVADPYCTSQPNARWSKTVSLDEWITYLIQNGFKPDPDVVTDFGFQQAHRIPDYTVNDLILPVKQLRADWQLRSAFFSVSVDREQVVLNGRGYGHGVGLCQEGAMEMGRRGFKYDEIISFYYKYVNLVPVTSLNIEVPEFEL